MSFDTLRNTAQPAFQAGRSAATTPISSAAVSNPGGFPPGPAGAPPGLSPQGSVAPGGMPFAAAQPGMPPGGAGAFTQTQPWAAGGNPVTQAQLAQDAMTGGPAALGSAMGAFAGGRGSTSPMTSPVGRFGGGK